MADEPRDIHRRNTSNNIINETGRAVGTAAGEIVNKAAPGVGTGVAVASEGIGNAAGSVIAGAGTAVGVAGAGIGLGVGAATAGAGALATGVGKAGEGIGAAGDGIAHAADSVSNAAHTVGNAAGAVSNAADKVTSIPSSFGKAAYDTGAGVGAGIGNAASGIGTGIGNAANGIANAANSIGNAANAVGNAVGSLSGMNIIHSGKNNDNNFATNASSPAAAILDKFKPSSSASPPSTTFTGRLGAAVDNVVERGKNAVYKKVSDTAGGIYDSTIGRVDRAITGVGNDIINKVNGIGDTIESINDGINVLDNTTRPEFDESSSGLLKYVKANGLGIGAGRVTQKEKYEKFARYERLDPNNWMGFTKEFIFFTTPDLQLFNGATLNPSIANNSLIVEASKRYNDVLQSLSYSACGRPFVNLLSNYKRSNVDLPDITTASDYETSKNILGSSIFYRGTSYESDENHEFSVEFEDTKYLEVYMWFRLFDEYERMKHYGLVDFVDDRYLNGKIIHDQMAMYKFIIGEDGESIIHYSKFIGVYPKNVPRSTFSDLPADGNVKFTINFKAAYVEDMDPNIILDFNEIAKKIPAGDPSLGGYMDEFNGWSGEYMQRPYIALPAYMQFQGGTAGSAVNNGGGAVTSGQIQQQMAAGDGFHVSEYKAEDSAETRIKNTGKIVAGTMLGGSTYIATHMDDINDELKRETSGISENFNNNMNTIRAGLGLSTDDNTDKGQGLNKFAYFQDPKYNMNYGFNETLPNKGFYKLKWEG